MANPSQGSGSINGFTTQTQPARVAGTVYQNTNASLPILVTVSASMGAGLSSQALCDANNPPTTVVASFSSTASGALASSATFIVPPGYYYKVTTTGTITSWTEWS